jgi:hypothetical protein
MCKSFYAGLFADEFLEYGQKKIRRAECIKGGIPPQILPPKCVYQESDDDKLRPLLVGRMQGTLTKKRKQK